MKRTNDREKRIYIDGTERGFMNSFSFFSLNRSIIFLIQVVFGDDVSNLKWWRWERKKGWYRRNVTVSRQTSPFCVLLSQNWVIKEPPIFQIDGQIYSRPPIMTPPSKMTLRRRPRRFGRGKKFRCRTAKAPAIKAVQWLVLGMLVHLFVRITKAPQKIPTI